MRFVPALILGVLGYAILLCDHSIVIEAGPLDGRAPIQKPVALPHVSDQHTICDDTRLAGRF